MRKLVIGTIACLALVACSEPARKSNEKRAGNADSASTTTDGTPTNPTVPGATTTPIATTSAEKALSLFVQKGVNKSLCSRLQTLRNVCRVNSRLIGDLGQSGLQCDVEAGTPISQTTFEILVEDGGAGAEYSLSANGGVYFTNKIKSGQKQKVTWSTQGSLTTAPPRLAELEELKVNSSSTGTVAKFALYVNGGDPIFDLTNVSANNLTLPTSTLKDMLQKPDCRVGPTEVDALVKQARENLEKEATNTPEKAAAPAGVSDEVLASQLSAEQEKTLRLTQELTADANVGCWLEKKIEKLEITFSGSVGDRPINCCWQIPHPPGSQEGTAPDAITVELGDLISVGKSDFVPAMTSGNASIVETNLSTHRILALTKLRVYRHGARFESRPSGDSKNPWYHYEIRYPTIQSITMKVNDQLIYQGNVNTALTSSSGLETISIQDKEAFQKLRSRSDCSVTQ